MNNPEPQSNCLMFSCKKNIAEKSEFEDQSLEFFKPMREKLAHFNFIELRRSSGIANFCNELYGYLSEHIKKFNQTDKNHFMDFNVYLVQELSVHRMIAKRYLSDFIERNELIPKVI